MPVSKGKMKESENTMLFWDIIRIEFCSFVFLLFDLLQLFFFVCSVAFVYIEQKILNTNPFFFFGFGCFVSMKQKTKIFIKKLSNYWYKNKRKKSIDIVKQPKRKQENKNKNLEPRKQILYVDDDDNIILVFLLWVFSVVVCLFCFGLLE